MDFSAGGSGRTSAPEFEPSAARPLGPELSQELNAFESVVFSMERALSCLPADQTGRGESATTSFRI